MSNDTKPLVSDEKIAERVDEYVLPYRTEITRVVKEYRDTYESELARYRSLAQVLVDLVSKCDGFIKAELDYSGTGEDRIAIAAALAKAKEDFDITPTDQ